ncbi:hypothetical protein K7432_003200 [Basidiobolus ranarum]|uniref:Uncharacterized protein n=1 Tax=Basidiobolus ranarum TaxID=34480 RepID=A0ABR2W6J5_9FUNG
MNSMNILNRGLLIGLIVLQYGRKIQGLHLLRTPVEFSLNKEYTGTPPRLFTIAGISNDPQTSQTQVVEEIKAVTDQIVSQAFIDKLLQEEVGSQLEETFFIETTKPGPFMNRVVEKEKSSPTSSLMTIDS